MMWRIKVIDLYLAGLVILQMRWQGCGGIGNGIITSVRR
jgi:hypothetical protein